MFNMSDTKQNQATKRKKDALVCLTDHNTFYVGFKGGGVQMWGEGP